LEKTKYLQQGKGYLIKLITLLSVFIMKVMGSSSQFIGAPYLSTNSNIWIIGQYLFILFIYLFKFFITNKVAIRIDKVTSRPI